jgi:hypothetical protein
MTRSTKSAVRIIATCGRAPPALLPSPSSQLLSHEPESVKAALSGALGTSLDGFRPMHYRSSRKAKGFCLKRSTLMLRLSTQVQSFTRQSLLFKLRLLGLFRRHEKYGDMKEDLPYPRNYRRKLSGLATCAISCRGLRPSRFATSARVDRSASDNRSREGR